MEKLASTFGATARQVASDPNQTTKINFNKKMKATRKLAPHIYAGYDG